MAGAASYPQWRCFMGTARKQRLAPREIQADRKRLVGLRSLTDYAPRNGAYNLDHLAASAR